MLLRAAAILSAGALLAGCGSHGHTAQNREPRSSSASRTVSRAVVLAAVKASAAQPGERVGYTLAGTLPGVDKVTITGTGSFDDAPARGVLHLHVAVPNASAIGLAGTVLTDLDLTVVAADGMLDVQVPSSLSSLAGSLTDEKSWVGIDLTALTRPGGQSRSPSGSATTAISPAAALRALKRVSGEVQPEGSTQIDGTTVTRYAGSLDAGNLDADLTTAQRQQLAREGTRLGQTKIPFTIAIDRTGLVRALTLQLSDLHLAGSTSDATLSLDFLAYGRQIVPPPPPAGQVDDITGDLAHLRLP